MQDECGSFEIGAGVDPRQELQAILRNGGGLRLGYRLMKESLIDHVRILFVAENPCWDYYTDELTRIKTPADNIIRSCKLGGSQWAQAAHLFETLQHTLLKTESLDFMQIPIGRSQKATRALHLSWTLSGKLGWTMSKHSAPPECYAAILQPGETDPAAAVRQACATELKTHHENVLSLEIARHSVADAQELWEACLFLDMRPIRLMQEYFRRDKYSPRSPDGRHLLMGLVGTLPDNKIVEDIHAPLRLASKGNSNDKLAAPSVQDVINHSKVFEVRGITHATAVPKDRFYLTNFKSFLDSEPMPWS